MKKMILLLFIVFGFSHLIMAQRNALQGSGNIVQSTFNFTDFDQIELLDLDGKMDVTAGKPFEIAVAIDDNLNHLLDIAVANRTLTVRLKGNLNNRLYVEETNIRIAISLPQLASIYHRSNGKLTVNGISGKSFRIKNTGNGSAFLYGAIDELDIVCRDNGSVYADKLTAKAIKANRSGNGNIYVNAEAAVTKQSSGNGNVIVLTKYNDKTAEPGSEAPKPVSKIKNLSSKTIVLSVKYPEKGSYGIDIKPNETISEYFPVGTRIFKGNQFTSFKSPVLVITEKNRQDTLTVR